MTRLDFTSETLLKERAIIEVERLIADRLDQTEDEILIYINDKLRYSVIINNDETFLYDSSENGKLILIDTFLNMAEDRIANIISDYIIDDEMELNAI